MFQLLAIILQLHIFHLCLSPLKHTFYLCFGLKVPSFVHLHFSAFDNTAMRDRASISAATEFLIIDFASYLSKQNLHVFLPDPSALEGHADSSQPKL